MVNVPRDDSNIKSDAAEWIDSGKAAEWRDEVGDNLLGGYAHLVEVPR